MKSSYLDRFSEPGDRPDQKPLTKKLYQRPAFRYEAVFETMALSCGKISSTQAQCRMVRKNS